MDANQRPGRYWIRFGGLLDCIETRSHAAAILVYDMDTNDNVSPLMSMGAKGENDYEKFTNISGLACLIINVIRIELD